ncbi:MAG: PAS domain S-box protein, partial [Planctomycetota bacterium]
GLHGRAATLRWRVASLDGVIRPKNIETRWRTDGGGWSPWSTERRAVVADVSPGAHRLTVQARNRLADAPVVQQEITFELPLPLHRQPLFLASTFGGVGGILILLAVMSARRRRHAAALRRHQELLDAIVADATDAIAVTDVEGHYLYVNPAASRWLGLPAEDLIGRREYDVVPPDCAERIRADDRRLLSRCSQDDQPHRFENTIERDGETVTYAVSKSVLRDGQGRPTAIVGIAHDVTEQRRVEEILRRGQRELEELVQQRTKELAAANESLRAEIAERARIELTLRESEQRLSDALDATSDGVWDWRIPENKSIRSDLWYSLTGYERGELEAYEAKHGSIIHPDDEPRMRKPLQAHLDGETATYRAEFRIRHKSGELRWILSRGRVMERAPDGAPLRMVGADTDITDLRRAEEARAALEEELRVARRMEALGTLAAGIAHDFNNCLMAILGYAGCAREHVSPTSAAAECLDGVCKTAEDAAALTRSLLDFARNEPPAREPIEFVAFLHDTLKRVRFTLPPGVELHADVPGDVRVWVAADATQLRQMLSNLVINACDAMPGGGRLTIAMRRLPAGESPTANAGDKPTAEDRIELCVSDTGEGMTAEVKARIFDPFFTTKQRGRGTGLGMAIVHRIVREHDGRIELDSSPGRGTRVIVTLPTCEPPEDPRPHGDEAEPVAESRSASTARILLAEDNEHVRPILKMGLERAGYEVLEARDGREALAIIEARGAELSLLVLDVNLPHASGVECLQAARRDAPD